MTNKKQVIYTHEPSITSIRDLLECLLRKQQVTNKKQIIHTHEPSITSIQLPNGMSIKEATCDQ